MKKFGNCIIYYIEEITSNVPEETEDIEIKSKVSFVINIKVVYF